MTNDWRGTPKRATLKTLAALAGALAVLGVGAYAVYAEVELGETPEVAAPSITAKPAELATQTSARFRFIDSQPGVTFQCSLDASRLKACASPKLYNGPLAEGRHTFRVRAMLSFDEGELYELSPVTSYTWFVHRRPLAPQIVRHPADPTRSTSATFAFNDREPRVGFECRLDSAAWRSCARRITYLRVGVGEHHLLVRAVDLSAVRSPSARFALAVRSPSARFASAVRSPSARFQWRVTQANGMTFSISAGTIAGLLYPGAAPLSIPVTLRNPNSVPIYVSNLTASVVANSLPAGCRSAWFQITESSISTATSVRVPADGWVTLPSQRAAAPIIQMIDSHTIQNACESANLTLSFSGSAHS